MNRKIVHFIRKKPPYNAGDTAGFSESEADYLIRQGIAVPYQAHHSSPGVASITRAPDAPAVDKMVDSSEQKDAASRRGGYSRSTKRQEQTGRQI